jgi:hypothetical protein
MDLRGHGHAAAANGCDVLWMVINLSLLARYDYEKDVILDADEGSWIYWHERGHQLTRRFIMPYAALLSCSHGYTLSFALMAFGESCNAPLFTLVGFVILAYEFFLEAIAWIYGLKALANSKKGAKE